MTQRAVVLLSGGLDSATALAVARAQGFETFALSFRYGQRHAVELDCARTLAHALGAARHVVCDIDLRVFGQSALTADIDVPKGRDPQHIGGDIPVTYVPARNTIFLSFATAWAEVLDAADIFIGVNALDYSGYPDCRPAFISAFAHMANLATRAGIEGQTELQIRTPLIELGKAQIIRLGMDLGVDFSLTCSCYDPAPDGRPCGGCDSCLLRARGFEQAGLADPLLARFAGTP
ncbi:MAG: 7-cyano-7-deazaguanine synthase QueC [Pseudomonadales bacterium]|nr:7-cyano-7-deazaguanine synthase QueC [Pseudomonadales bacterium]